MNFLLLLHQYLQPHQSLSNMAEMNNSIYSQMEQDLAIKIREHEDEITRLRNRLEDYSIKEARIRHENQVLEKRIENMHLGYVEQHQEMVDAASRALLYRQGVIEKNIRLTYALQVLFKHLQEQLIGIQNKDGLKLVPQSGTDRDILDRHWSGCHGNGGAAENVDADECERRQTRTNLTRGIPTKQGEEKTKKEVKFREPGNNSEVVDDPDGEGNHQHGEQTSEVSSAADDDPLPAIEDLQISGEPFPRTELQACGYSINGTTSCKFKWIRHLEDGSVNYIDEAKEPTYHVTADDVDTCLAVEVQPLDDRERKGEPVKVFANDNKKITCDPEMQSYIEKTFFSGHASYKVSLSTGYLDIWEPAILAIKRKGYSIKGSGPSGIVAAEKFSPSINVVIPYGHVSEFIIVGSSGAKHKLRAENSSTDVRGSRDTIVLTMRLFILRSGEKRRGKKKGLFFNK